jgi:hypothetical protein
MSRRSMTASGRGVWSIIQSVAARERPRQALLICRCCQGLMELARSRAAASHRRTSSMQQGNRAVRRSDCSPITTSTRTRSNDVPNARSLSPRAKEYAFERMGPGDFYPRLEGAPVRTSVIVGMFPIALITLGERPNFAAPTAGVRSSFQLRCPANPAGAIGATHCAM